MESNNLYNNVPGIKELSTKDLIRHNNGSILPVGNDFNNKVFMLIYYAPWCGHCKDMVKDVKTLANTLKDEGFIVGTINCERNSDLNDKIIIDSFPTVYFVKENKAIKYDGSRELEDLVNFLCVTLGKCAKKK
jgi:thioredoxin-like negative regulator of GroEL